jgi:ABC-2 type transport system ATP-binding protein
MALLEAVDLCKVYRHQWTMRPVRALENLSLSLREGEVFGLIGPNGAGKTTTIKLLLALLRPTRGRVEFRGLPVSSSRARRGMGFLPEQAYFYDYLTVEETLRFYAQLCGLSPADRRQRIAELIERLQLGPFRRRTMRQLSKGNLQRVGIAQAILHRPELAILDEPMSGLDPGGRKEMRDLIASLRSEGTTVIFSSHILPDAEALCDRVAIMVGGRLRDVLELSPDDHSPGPFLVSASGLSPAKVAELGRISLRPPAGGPKRWQFHLADRAAAERVVGAIVAAGGFIESLQPVNLSLEERFLSYVRQGPSAD